MKLPLSWLRDYVDVDASARDIADRLTFSGTEVEGIETVGSDFAGIVVGEIVAVEPHPRADRLKVCRVNDGRQVLQVVCGAPDVKVGDKAPFAGVGVTLPGGMQIREAKLRGESSFGMLCAEDELGISDDHSGLMALPPEAAAGAALSSILGPPEVVLNVEITWNRPDCLSIIGMAREVAALFRLPLRRPDIRLQEAGEAAERAVSVSIEAPQDCLRYTARVIRGVVPGPSPAWMQKRLTLCGVRPINSLVDITNYVMLECGQPLHAFDYDLLRGRRILVRRARAGEPFATLDGVPRSLDPNMLVIADAERAVALAGVMGGAGSEIGDATRTVLLESAAFAAPGIHRTSTRLGLVSESSRRFERGVDVGAADWAANRAAALTAELAGGAVAPGLVDVYPGRPAVRRISLRYAHARRVLGVDVTPDEITATLDALQVPVVDRGAEACTVEAPTFRPDLEIEADLVEEVARIVGLERVPEAPAASRVVSGMSEAPFRAESACRGSLVGLGLTETLNYSFVGPQLLDRFTPAEAARRVVLPNPVSAEYSVMRDALAPQMVETLGRNLSRQVGDVRGFEMGRVFLRDASGAIREEDRVCIGLMGAVGRSPSDLRRPVEAGEMFLWLKGVVEGLLSALHAGEVAFRAAACPWMDPDAAVEVLIGGRPAGLLGLVSRAVRREWRMQAPVGVAELSLKALVAGAFRPPELKPVPAFPAIVRDVAMVVGEGVRHDDVVRVVRSAAPSELTHIELFDIFRSEGLGQGRKSVAYAFEFRSLTRSLTDEDANRFRDAIRNALVRELSAEMRE
jgi:phenylalanyl-tRNA synthetase beta chain